MDFELKILNDGESTRTVDSKYVFVLSNLAPCVALEALQVQTFG